MQQQDYSKYSRKFGKLVVRFGVELINYFVFSYFTIM